MKEDFSVSPAPAAACAPILAAHHYLTGVSKGFKSGFNVGLFKDGEIAGCCIFTAFPVPELVVGLFGLPRDDQRGMWELSRLVLRPDVQAAEHNLAGWFTARAETPARDAPCAGRPELRGREPPRRHRVPRARVSLLWYGRREERLLGAPTRRFAGQAVAWPDERGRRRVAASHAKAPLPDDIRRETYTPMGGARMTHNPADMTSIGTHRYRFYCLFEGTGDMLENSFSVPGNVPAAEADLIATAYWVETVGSMVGGPAPRSMNAPKNAFTNKMANYAIQRASYEVMRPGELV